MLIQLPHVVRHVSPLSTTRLLVKYTRSGGDRNTFLTEEFFVSKFGAWCYII